MTESSRFYRTHAAEGSTHADLLIAVYDALAEDLRRVAAAVAHEDIAARCNVSNRALLLLGHLDSWVEFLGEPALQQSLTQFYSYLRSEILRLQTTTSPEPFRALALQVSETRAAWQKKLATAPEPDAPIPVAITVPQEQRMSWTA